MLPCCTCECLSYFTTRCSRIMTLSCRFVPTMDHNGANTNAFDPRQFISWAFCMYAEYCSIVAKCYSKMMALPYQTKVDSLYASDFWNKISAKLFQWTHTTIVFYNTNLLRLTIVASIWMQALLTTIERILRIVILHSAHIRFTSIAFCVIHQWMIMDTLTAAFEIQLLFRLTQSSLCG